MFFSVDLLLHNILSNTIQVLVTFITVFAAIGQLLSGFCFYAINEVTFMFFSCDFPIPSKDEQLSSISPHLLNIFDYRSKSAQVIHRAPHSHTSFLEIMLLTSGDGTVFIDNKPFYCHKTDLIIYNQNVLHDDSYIGNALPRVIQCDQLQIPGLPENHLIPPCTFPVISTGTFYPLFFQYWEQMYSILKKKNTQNISVLHTLLISLLSLIHQLVFAQKGSLISPDSFSNEIASYLHKNIHKNLSLRNLSNTFHVSQSVISHRFKAEFGISPKQYWTQLRMGEAQNLLFETQIPIMEIAYLVGYDNLSNFIYSFKKHCGMLPSEFRNYAIESKKINSP